VREEIEHIREGKRGARSWPEWQSDSSGDFGVVRCAFDDGFGKRGGRFSAIRTNEAIDFEDEESLSHPRNQVYAIIDDAENARRAATELNSIGIEPANIGLLIGKERYKTGRCNR